MMNDEQFFQK